MTRTVPNLLPLTYSGQPPSRANRDSFTTTVTDLQADAVEWERNVRRSPMKSVGEVVSFPWTLDRDINSHRASAFPRPLLINCTPVVNDCRSLADVGVRAGTQRPRCKMTPRLRRDPGMTPGPWVIGEDPKPPGRVPTSFFLKPRGMGVFGAPFQTLRGRTAPAEGSAGVVAGRVQRGCSGLPEGVLRHCFTRHVFPGRSPP